ncbi:MAG: hypothetical protein ACI8UO_001646 [Verrucomicrobiales bacterium]|jgi:hypothetical protein
MKILIGAIFLSATMAFGQAEAPPSFEKDVMPIFFRSGCNAGTCHGSARGKDGFMLSLFGYDPGGDYYRLTQEMIGRRVNVAMPEKSLILLKATGKVPHTGGEVFTKDSESYKALHDWIAAGALADEGEIAKPVEITLEPANIVFRGGEADVPTTVTARYSDGTTRDVTRLALFNSNNPATATIDENGLVKPGNRGDTFVFARFNRFTIGSEVIVLPTDSQFEWTKPPAANYIDELVLERLEKLHIRPSGLCDDETFLRRVYLDLSGLPPTVEQYHAFIENPDRDALIQQLLADENFADVWTGLWGEWVRLMGGGYSPTATDVKAADAYYRWIHQQFSQNRPIDEFVAEQITASGSCLTNGPTNLYTMLVHDVRFKPKNFAADFSQLMTGIQIQCAECHNHPFDRWTIDDYYGFVSFFTGMNRKLGAEPREYYIYNDLSAEPAKHLVDQRPMPATVLGGEAPAPAGVDQRQALADWLISPDNELFARNFVNRVWAHHFHRGLVEPIDDLRVSNPPTNPALLDALAQQFIDSGYDLRALVSDICRSETYQRALKPNATNQSDDRQFSRARLRRLRSDVFLDAMVAATDSEHGFSYFPAGTKAIEYYPRSPGDTVLGSYGNSFFETFGRSNRASICACEMKPEPTLSQALHLLVGSTVPGRVGGGRVVSGLLEAGRSPTEIIEEIYIRALSRKPSEVELAGMLGLVGDDEKSPKPYEDIFSSLLNTTEFGFNH